MTPCILAAIFVLPRVEKKTGREIERLAFGMYSHAFICHLLRSHLVDYTSFRRRFDLLVFCFFLLSFKFQTLIIIESLNLFFFAA